jgi:hypothetical protein
MSARICRPASISCGFLSLGVADPAADELLEGDPRFDDAVGGEARLGHAQVERHIGAALGEAAVHLDHLPRVAVLERDAVPCEVERIEQFAVLPGAFEHRRDRVVLVELLFLGRIDAAAIDADAEGTVVVPRDGGDVSHLVLPRAGRLVVIEVARVVADLIDVRGDQLGQAVVFLQIDRQVRLRLLANFGQGLGVLLAIDSNADDIGSGLVQQVHEPDGGVDILRVRGRHALHGDRMAAANGGGADSDGASGIAGELHVGNSGAGWKREAIMPF